MIDGDGALVGNSQPEILYRGRGVIVALKPPGVLSEAAGEGSMPRLLAARIMGEKADCGSGNYSAGNSAAGASKRGRAGVSAEIYTIHRLDRGVGGLIAYALSPGAAADLSRQIGEGSFKKEYFAVVHGRPDMSEGYLRDLLYFDRAKNKSFVVGKPRRGVREAELAYRLLGSAAERELHLPSAAPSSAGEQKEASLLGVTLITGRTHQIRVQLSSRGMPILGDRRYGSRAKGVGIALFSAGISFREPGGGDVVAIKASPPDDYPWNLFGNSDEYYKCFI